MTKNKTGHASNHHKCEEAPLTLQEAGELINQRAASLGLGLGINLVFMVAATIVGISLFTSEPPVSMTGHLAIIGLVLFEILILGVLFIVHAKPISFDGRGVYFGWFWTPKQLYEWDKVMALESLSFIPNFALLKLEANTHWPIFMDLDAAQDLHAALSIWKSARS